MSTCKAHISGGDCRGKQDCWAKCVPAVVLWALLLSFFLVASLARADGGRPSRNMGENLHAESVSIEVLPAARLHSEFTSFKLAQLGEPVRHADLHAGALGVIYPDLGEPYRSIFSQMIEGIAGGARATVYRYPITPGADSRDLDTQLKRNGVKVVIALGRQGLKTASSLDRDMPVIVGGVLTVPESQNRSLASISLTPDPALLFARLKSLLGSVRRVTVIYDPRYNDWLIKLAREAAKAQGLELVAYEARDLATAARLYESAFASSDGRRDAIWLPQDATTVDEATILPLVLNESWNRSIPVFSSSFLHVKKGVLFALYPDNLNLGHTLAATAQAVLSGDFHKRGMLPLRDVYTAVNIRTASHLGLNIGYQQQRNFDFIFPEP